MPRTAAQEIEQNQARSERIDWSDWYLTDEDDMGEGCEQGEIIRLFMSVLACLAMERGWQDYYIGADNFFAWIEEEPLVRVSPDVYLLFGVGEGALPASWQIWRPGHPPPRFAVEIVSEDWKKDYDEVPQKYEQLGVQELVVYDPWAAQHGARDRVRVPLQAWERTGEGELLRHHSGAAPVYSRVLGAFVREHCEGGQPRLRLSRDEAGEQLYPSSPEHARFEAQQRVEAEQRAEQHAFRAEQQALRAETEARQRVEAEQRAEQQALRAEQQALRAETEARQRVEAERKAERLEAEMAELKRRLGLEPDSN